MRERIPYPAAIKIARRHLPPFNRRVPRLQYLGQAPRGLGNDFEAASHGIKPKPIILKVSQVAPAAKLAASSMRYAMSRSARVAAPESIKGVGGRGGADAGFQRLAIHDIDRTVEQGRNIFLKSPVTPHPHACFGIDLHHDSDIAAGPVVAARPQRGFVLAQSGKDLLAVPSSLNATESCARQSRPTGGA